MFITHQCYVGVGMNKSGEIILGRKTHNAPGLLEVEDGIVRPPEIADEPIAEWVILAAEGKVSEVTRLGSGSHRSARPVWRVYE